MIIVPGSNFVHAGNIPARYDTFDPRADGFAETEVVVDLRGCEIVHPPAILWCVVYLLLASQRGASCTLWVPINTGVASYLRDVGLFELLKSKQIDVDDRGLPAVSSSQTILPLTQFNTETEAEQLTNDTSEHLVDSGIGSANLYPIVTENFAELAMNAAQHSKSSIGSFGLVQFFGSEGKRKFICAVADGGVGIRESLMGNSAYREKIPYDWTAIELASRERISGTGNPYRGIGLYGVSEDMHKPGRQLIIHSGIGSLRINEDLEFHTARTRLFPGTLASVWIPA